MDFVGKMEKVEISNVAPQKEFSFFDNIHFFAGDHHNLISREIANQREEVDRIIRLHDNSLRRTLVGVLHRNAEEKAAKTLKAKDLELEAKFARIVELEKAVSYYKAMAEWQQSIVDFMERENEALEKRLRDMKRARRYAARVEDGAESSCGDLGRVEPVRLVCTSCKRRPATVMVWPCRHACLCTTCDEYVKVCLICRARITSTTRLRLLFD